MATIDLSSFSLWDHQIAAIKKMEEYIIAYRNSTTKNSALVHMPTGSGKTGVIAVLSRCSVDMGTVLVLTNRISIREQLTRHITSEFFANLIKKPDLDSLQKEVVEVHGPFNELDYKKIDDSIFVMTIQKLQYLFTNKPKDYDTLLGHVELILFDEGHYEPAPKWSEVIRSFQVPRILFSATPYRNDLKLFEVDPKYIFSYTYDEGIQDGIVREVEVVTRKPTINPITFIEDVIDFYDVNLGKKITKDSRVIIRCDNEEDIRKLCKILRERNRTVIALHENFSNTDQNHYEYKTVPNPKSIDATFWIHQFKLLEGIDDSRFQVVAIFKDLENVRQLIQQVGRVVRNPNHKHDEKGILLDYSEERKFKKSWEGYLKYDSNLKDTDDLAFAIGLNWYERVLSSQPGLVYVGGTFKETFNINEIGIDDISIPQKVTFIQKLDNFDLDKFSHFIEAGYRKADKIYQEIYTNDGKTNHIKCYIYLDLIPSSYLRNKIFFDIKLNLSIFYELDNLLAFYDDRGFQFRNEKKIGIGKPIDSRQIKKLFIDNDDTFLTRVSLKNTNLGIQAIRSRILSAASLNETVELMDDHSQICTTATGYIPEIKDGTEIELTRRYVGITNGKVIQSKRELNFNNYIAWVDNLYKILESTVDPNKIFNRYSPEFTEEIPDPSPKHILLDLFEIENKLRLVDQKFEKFEVADKACEIKNGKFIIVANKNECEVDIHFDTVRGIYVLKSADLDSLYVNSDVSDKKGIVGYLNQSQSFRVIPNTPNIVYVYGNFYKPLYKVGKEFNTTTFPMAHILFDIPVLEKVISEKDPALENHTGWNEATLFGLIDNLGEGTELVGHFGQPDIVVCDDMGTEIADFILGYDSPSKIILIHAKGAEKNSKHPYSATALQEVCGQAIKNISYLGLFNTSVPPELKQWDGNWSHNDSIVYHRIRRGQGNSIAVWNEIRQRINNPLTDKEVWLFLGRTLSKERLFSELKKDIPTPEAVQVAFLLHGTMTAVASVGAKLKIFCYP